jgi:hypothetical protein
MPNLPDTVYIAVWADRHTDTRVIPFVYAHDAIAWARDKVRSLDPDYLDEELLEGMRDAGWLYYGCYSLEDDHIRVVPSPLHWSNPGRI